MHGVSNVGFPVRLGVVASSSLQHTADIFDNAGCVVVQLGASREYRCERTAAKINGHPDYAGAPAIGCDPVSGFYLTPHICGMALLAGVALLVAFLILINVLLLCPSDRVAAAA